ncbi:MAG TPA: bifunctional 2-polyprenyl-6-hydroxyphenol methylase/3-demethylubiquinol 3-O-methyltransferase UbiG [Rhabdochlamydiaceae bacterium]|jgi:2-polyprenyl-6-hydroxyphenyl methylase/3-demethylubiquinone-9 3-methyltransferase|nr:bifunctional 2-polyprenyl-6-hydroxyphenol methylase/3-demethylubiquinol 3-O-methyltransferase UbiG [Rhabdochlamydiaceae bacterium]
MKTINNDFYEELGDKWVAASDHPIALLRAENRLRNPWIASRLPSHAKVLDMGCGAGFLTHDLARLGHEVTGIDLSEDSLRIAKKLDETGRIKYIQGDATAVPLPENSLDVVCAMDLLEHVENPKAVIQEAARLLKPGGLFFFHTFNRTFLSWLVVIKGVEWCVKNAPPDMHIFRLFITPEELQKMCEDQGLQMEEMRGLNVKFSSKPFWQMVFKRIVPEDLEFIFTDSLKTGYSGVSRKAALS